VLPEKELVRKFTHNEHGIPSGWRVGKTSAPVNGEMTEFAIPEPASPSEYLERIAEYNDALEDSVRLVGASKRSYFVKERLRGQFDGWEYNPIKDQFTDENKAILPPGEVKDRINAAIRQVDPENVTRTGSSTVTRSLATSWARMATDERRSFSRSLGDPATPLPSGLEIALYAKSSP